MCKQRDRRSLTGYLRMAWWPTRYSTILTISLLCPSVGTSALAFDRLTSISSDYVNAFASWLLRQFSCINLAIFLFYGMTTITYRYHCWSSGLFIATARLWVRNLLTACGLKLNQHLGLPLMCRELNRSLPCASYGVVDDRERLPGTLKVQWDCPPPAICTDFGACKTSLPFSVGLRSAVAVTYIRPFWDWSYDRWHDWCTVRSQKIYQRLLDCFKIFKSATTDRTTCDVRPVFLLDPDDPGKTEKPGEVIRGLGAECLVG